MSKSRKSKKKKTPPGKLQQWLLAEFRKLNLRIESKFDKDYLAKDVPAPKLVGHGAALNYLSEIGDKPGFRILEVGSREVTGRSSARERFSNGEYVGFDYYAGNNVNVVGDAHKLSSYFSEGDKFDIIYSSACFEHFAMPWIVAVEMAKLLKIGGLVFVETHFAFSTHERPWHFFHFSDAALKVLFSKALGFECIEAGMSNPIVGRFSSLAAPYLRHQPVRKLYCHSEYLGKKVREVPCFDWATVDTASVVGETKYPEPKGQSTRGVGGMVIYKENPLDADSKAKVAIYRSVERFSVMHHVLIEDGETLSLFGNHGPIYIPEAGAPNSTRHEAIRAIESAKKSFPQFRAQLEGLRRAWEGQERGTDSLP